MQNTHEILSTGTTGTSRVKPTGTTDTFNNKYENDALYDQLPDLVNAQYRRWFCGHFYRLGRERVLQLAAVARAEGKEPAKYFAKLLKNS